MKRFLVAYLSSAGNGAEPVDADDHGHAIDLLRQELERRIPAARDWYQVTGATDAPAGFPPVDDGPADNYGAW